MNHKSTHE